jgi:thioredoxin reductase (NADPH)
MKDCIIIGAGPAGLTAAIYGLRSGLDLLVLEKFSPGGQVINTYEVENYPGFVEPVAGWELMQKMEEQTRRLGAEIKSEQVTTVERDDAKDCLVVKAASGETYEAKSVILATGSTNKTLNVPGEAEYTGKGVSYCATCDGAFYKDKVTAVVGGGDTALEEAYFLTRFASKVYLIHRRDAFRASKIVQDRALGHEKIEVVYNATVETINGQEKVSSITVKDKETGELSTIDTDGVFIFIGYDSNTGCVNKDLLNEFSEIKVDSRMRTSVKGLFAAGDMRSDTKKQIVMACADGATAAMEVYDYIIEHS